MSRGYQKGYCAFCQSPRQIYTKKHAGFAEVFYTFWLAFSLGLLLWQEINPRFIPIWMTVLGLTEVLIQLRWRISITCQKCGFDPVLYLRDPKRAAFQVRQSLKTKLANPNNLNKRLPVIDRLLKEKNVKRGYQLKWSDDEKKSDTRGVPSVQNASESLPSNV